jgi:hypothetical protein
MVPGGLWLGIHELLSRHVVGRGKDGGSVDEKVPHCNSRCSEPTLIG